MKIKLKYTKLQILLEIIALLILVGSFLYLFVRWGDLPDKVPGHYNFAGEVDRWGNKSELILVPAAEAFLYLLLTVVGFFPAIWNMPVTVTERNKERVYHCVKNMLLIMKVEIMAAFTYLTYHGIEGGALPWVFLPAVLITVFGTTIFFIIRTVKVSKL